MAVNKVLYVVDTSVLLKFLLDEKEDKEQALLLKKNFIAGNIGIIVPSIFFYEVGNILMRKMPTREAMNAISLMKMAGLEQCELDDWLIYKTLSLVNGSKKISFYDASYHALALEHDITYLTADKKYYDQMKHKGNMKLLKDWKQE